MGSKLVLKNDINSEFSISHINAIGSKLLSTNDFKYIRDTVKDMLDLNSKLEDGDVVFLKGYHSVNNGGAGTFVYNASGSKEEHNGGTIIDLSKVFPENWNDQNSLDNWFNNVNSGNGVLERVYNDSVNVSWFGAKGDGVTDDTKAIQKCIDNNDSIYFPIGKYIISLLNLGKEDNNFYSKRIIGQKNSYAELNGVKIFGKIVCNNLRDSYLRNISLFGKLNLSDTIYTKNTVIDDTIKPNIDYTDIGIEIKDHNSKISFKNMRIYNFNIGIGISTDIDENNDFMYFNNVNTYNTYISVAMGGSQSRNTIFENCNFNKTYIILDGVSVGAKIGGGDVTMLNCDLDQSIYVLNIDTSYMHLLIHKCYGEQMYGLGFLGYFSSNKHSVDIRDCTFQLHNRNNTNRPLKHFIVGNRDVVVLDNCYITAYNDILTACEVFLEGESKFKPITINNIKTFSSLPIISTKKGNLKFDSFLFNKDLSTSDIIFDINTLINNWIIKDNTELDYYIKNNKFKIIRYFIPSSNLTINSITDDYNIEFNIKSSSGLMFNYSKGDIIIDTSNKIFFIINNIDETNNILYCTSPTIIDSNYTLSQNIKYIHTGFIPTKLYQCATIKDSNGNNTNTFKAYRFPDRYDGDIGNFSVGEYIVPTDIICNMSGSNNLEITKVDTTDNYIQINATIDMDIFYLFLKKI